ncbi:MAG: prepilin-type N-terminal cleavage/methylation domain-containing protein [Elusimicrobiaceae bacterium]|nr:prepilin-type N-terminal cleavage/methylation domain-containing protein [Elusimicrobiaceae bacterium]
MGRVDAKAFTLIELLVVVLIIGILAAVALPKYQVAVAKSKATQALSAIKAIREAQMRYHLANGTFSSDIAELDITFANFTEGGSGWLNSYTYCVVYQKTGSLAFCNISNGSTTILQWSLPLTSTGYGYCYVRNNRIGDIICAQLTGKKNPVVLENGNVHEFSFSI